MIMTLQKYVKKEVSNCEQIVDFLFLIGYNTTRVKTRLFNYHSMIHGKCEISQFFKGMS